MNGRDEILTAQEVAGILKCSVSFVYGLRTVGGLAPRYKFGGGRKGWRWTRGDVDAYVNAHEISVEPFDAMVPKFIPIDLTRRAC